MLQAEYRTQVNTVEKLWIYWSMEYRLVMGQCADYLQSQFKVQDKWEVTSNEWDLLALIKIIYSLLHKYDEGK